MAKRICFISTPESNSIFQELMDEFKFYNGFALEQKRKSIISFHESILKLNKSLKVLEISSKSMDPVGIALSAFNLKFYDEIIGKEFSIENVFQSSKVFEEGGPYNDLLYVSPINAKRDQRLKSSGKLIYFKFHDLIWNKEPKSMFYDWLYINSLSRNDFLSKKIIEYDTFTDIEFNHKKSINCQARSAAIFVSLYKLGLISETLNNLEKFIEIYSKINNINEQMTIYDI